MHHLKRLDLAEEGFGSTSAFISKHLYWRSERIVPPYFDHIRVTTERLAREIQPLHPQAYIHTVPIALDPSLYEPVKQAETHWTLGLIGSMTWDLGYRAAVRLITRIWPRVRQRLPKAKLLVAGWRADQMLGHLSETPGLTILSDVPHPRQFFEQIDALVYPLTIGSGMKVKLLETMAYGIPVVSTSEGLEGIAAEPGVQAYRAEDDEALSEYAIELLCDQERRLQMGRAGRELVEARYAPAATGAQVEAIYREVA